MPKTRKLPPGQTMLYWLAQAAKSARDRVGKRPHDIAKMTGVGLSSVYRFEEGVTWPRRIDEIVAAYAEAAGIPDGRNLWSLALKLWFQFGQPPTEGDLEHHITEMIRKEVEKLSSKAA